MAEHDVVDEKAGWSTQCRAGNFDTCRSLGYKCANPRHPARAETTAERGERLLAEAKARREAGEPEAPAAAEVDVPDIEELLAQVPDLTERRTAVLAALAAAGGEIENGSGRASSVLFAASGYDGSMHAFTALLAAMDRDGLIDRETRGTRTYRISVTELGERMATPHAPDEQPTEPMEQPRPLALVPPLPAPEAEAEPTAEAVTRVGGRRAAPSRNPVDPRDAKVDIVWEAPTPRTNGRRTIVEVLDGEGVFDALRARPGEWARVVEYGGNGGAASAASKLGKAEQLAGFEWTSKRKPLVDGVSQGSLLYGRYVGGDV